MTADEGVGSCHARMTEANEPWSAHRVTLSFSYLVAFCRAYDCPVYALVPMRLVSLWMEAPQPCAVYDRRAVPTSAVRCLAWRLHTRSCEFVRAGSETTQALSRRGSLVRESRTASVHLRGISLTIDNSLINLKHLWRRGLVNRSRRDCDH